MNPVEGMVEDPNTGAAGTEEEGMVKDRVDEDWREENGVDEKGVEVEGRPFQSVAAERFA